MGKKLIAVLLLLVMILVGCSNEIEAPSGVSNLPPKPETPWGLTASLGNGQVQLSWAVNHPENNKWYVIYYSDSAAEDMLVFDTVSEQTGVVEELVNGRRYYFRVSAVDLSGIEGDQSTPVVVTPGIFSISIAGGKQYTNKRSTTIGLTAPQGTNLVQLSEDTLFAGAHWETFSVSKNFELSDGDETKTVYAQFELEAGGTSVEVISDSITLDRKAVIDSVFIFLDDVEITSATLLAGGDILRFEVYVSEESNQALIDIEGLEVVTLNDFGIGGDIGLVPDSIYGAEYIIPEGTELSEAGVMARFTDAAGNIAPDLISDVRLNVTSAPPAVMIWGFAVSSDEIQLLWNQSQINDFSRYRLFKADVDSIINDIIFYSDSILVTQIVNAAEIRYLHGGLEETSRYAYWIYVDDTHGNSARSETTVLETIENAPPAAVTIWGFAISSDQIQLLWNQSQINDFSRYRLFRATWDTVLTDTIYNDDSILVAQIVRADETRYLQGSLEEASRYAYWIYVDDTHGNSARSETAYLETIKNTPPDTLSIITLLTGDSLTVEVNWTQITQAEDFQAYYIFRNNDTLPSFDSTDHTSYPEDFLIELIGDPQTKSYRDINVPDTGTYYYQVYVVDRQGMVSRSNQDSINVPW